MSAGRRSSLLRSPLDPAEREMLRVAIVEERQLIVDALIALLERAGRFDVIPFVEPEIDLSALAAVRPDLVLVSSSPTRELPWRMFEALRRRAPHIRTVLLADAQDPELVHCVLENRMSALVLTASTGDDLVVTLDQVVRGQTCLPVGWQSVVSSPERDPVGALSERQLEVLRLLADGFTYDQIAAQLVITVNTVKFHVRSIYLRLGVGNRIAARKQLEAHEPRHLRALAH